MFPASPDGSFVPANGRLEMRRFFPDPGPVRLKRRNSCLMSNKPAAVTPVGVRSALILTIRNCHEGHVCLRTKNNEVQQQKGGKKKPDVAYCTGFVGDLSSEHRQRRSFSPLITTV